MKGELAMDIKNLAVDSTQISKEYQERFLDMNHLPELIRVAPKSSTDVYYIYVIENLKNGKRYVGKAKNIYARATDYTRGIRNADSYNTKKYRFMMKTLYEEGIENFIMYPIATCDGNVEAGYLEVEMMQALNTLYPYGYNIRSAHDFVGRRTNYGYAHSVKTKAKKSKIMVCLHPELKSGFISIGMKLFGDFIGSSKDQVKNCAKRPCKHHGYYIFYMNDIDREAVSNSFTSRMGVGTRNNIPDYVMQYLELSELVGQFAHNPSKEIFKDYDMNFLTYNTDTSMNSSTYVVEPFDAFFEILNEK